jgi:hypothetical protein
MEAKEVHKFLQGGDKRKEVGQAVFLQIRREQQTKTHHKN